VHDTAIIVAVKEPEGVAEFMNSFLSEPFMKDL
jgi:hypothetical protein